MEKEKITKTFLIGDSKAKTYGIYQTDKPREELNMLFECDIIRLVEDIPTAQEQAKVQGFQYVGFDMFYK